MSRLACRVDAPSAIPNPNDLLNEIRQSIDNIDAVLINVLAERFKFTQTVGRIKASAGIPPSDPAREKRQIKRMRELATASHLDPAFAESFFEFIVREVIRHHERIATESPLE